MSELPNVEWHGAVDFAEVAEALGVPTTSIMAARNPSSDSVFVLYSPDESELERIYSATLKRGTDGVLFVSSTPVEQPGLWDQLMRRAEQELPPLIEKRLDEEMPGWRDQRKTEE